MSGADHCASDAVSEAARWYATHKRDPDKPAVLLLRERFGLTPLQACEAIAEAHLIRARAL